MNNNKRIEPNSERVKEVKVKILHLGVDVSKLTQIEDAFKDTNSNLIVADIARQEINNDFGSTLSVSSSKKQWFDNVDRIILVINGDITLWISNILGPAINDWLNESSKNGLITMLNEKFIGVKGDNSASISLADLGPLQVLDLTKDLNDDTSGTTVTILKAQASAFSANNSYGVNAAHLYDSDGNAEDLKLKIGSGKLNIASLNDSSFKMLSSSQYTSGTGQDKNVPFQHVPAKAHSDATVQLSVTAGAFEIPLVITKKFKKSGQNFDTSRPEQVAHINMDINGLTDVDNEGNFKTILKEAVSFVGYKEGCTDETAVNYDNEATQNDNSCRHISANMEVSTNADELLVNDDLKVDLIFDMFDTKRPSTIQLSDIMESGAVALSAGSVENHTEESDFLSDLSLNGALSLVKATDTNHVLYGEDKKGHLDGNQDIHWTLHDAQQSVRLPYHLAHSTLTQEDISEISGYQAPITDTNDANYNADKTIYGTYDKKYWLSIELTDRKGDDSNLSTYEQTEKIYAFSSNVFKKLNALGTKLIDTGAISDVKDDNNKPTQVELKITLPTGKGLPEVYDTDDLTHDAIDKFQLKLLRDGIVINSEKIDYLLDNDFKIEEGKVKRTVTIANSDTDDKTLGLYELRLSILNNGEDVNSRIKNGSDDEFSYVSKQITLKRKGCMETVSTNYDSWANVHNDDLCSGGFKICNNTNADNYGKTSDDEVLKWTVGENTDIEIPSSLWEAGSDSCYKIACNDTNASNYELKDFTIKGDNSLCQYRYITSLEIERNHLTNKSLMSPSGEFIQYVGFDAGFRVKVAGKVNLKDKVMLVIGSDQVELKKDTNTDIEISYNEVKSKSLGTHDIYVKVTDENNVEYHYYINDKDSTSSKIKVRSLGCTSDEGTPAEDKYGGVKLHATYANNGEISSSDNDNINSYGTLLSDTFYPELKTELSELGGNACDVLGCTDSNKLNYDADATPSNANADSACGDVKVVGCQDDKANNYNPSANAGVNSAECSYPPEVIEGCTDPNACNYNSNASANNPIASTSCKYVRLEFEDSFRVIEQNSLFQDTTNSNLEIKFKNSSTSGSVVDPLKKDLSSLKDSKHTIGTQQFTFVVSNGQNKIKVPSQTNALSNSSWETFDNVKFRKDQAGATRPYNLSFTIYGAPNVWYALLDNELLAIGDAFTSAPGFTDTALTRLEYTSKISSSRQSADVYDFLHPGCNLDYVQIKKGGLVLKLNVPDEENNGEYLETDKIYNMTGSKIIDSDDIKSAVNNKVSPTGLTFTNVDHKWSLKDSEDNELDTVTIANRYSGCNEADASNYDSFVNNNLDYTGSVSDGSCVFAKCLEDKRAEGYTSYNASPDTNCNVTYACSNDVSLCQFTGCMDSNSLSSYDPELGDNDFNDYSMCLYTFCDNSYAYNYDGDYKNSSDLENLGVPNSSITIDNSLCKFSGCVDKSSLNYQVWVSSNGGSEPTPGNPDAFDCRYEYCGDSDACNYKAPEDFNVHETKAAELDQMINNSDLCKKFTVGINSIKTTKYYKKTHVEYTLDEVDVNNNYSGSAQNVGDDSLLIDIDTSALKSVHITFTDLLDNADSQTLSLWTADMKQNDGFADEIYTAVDTSGYGDDSVPTYIRLFKSSQSNVLTKNLVGTEGNDSKQFSSNEDTNGASYNTSINYQALVALPLDNVGDIGFGEGYFGDKTSADLANLASDDKISQIKYTWIPFTLEYSQDPQKLPVETTSNFINRYNVKLTIADESLYDAIKIKYIYIETPDDMVKKASYSYRSSFPAILGDKDNNFKGMFVINKGSKSSITRKSKQALQAECIVDHLKLDIDDVNGSTIVTKNIYTSNDIELIDVKSLGLSLGEQYDVKLSLVQEKKLHDYVYPNLELYGDSKSIRVHPLGCNDTNYTSHESSDYTYLQYSITLDSILTNSCENIGCLDSTASNYNKEMAENKINIHKVDLCEYNGYGVSDSTACNYDGSELDANNLSVYGKWKNYWSKGEEVPQADHKETIVDSLEKAKASASYLSQVDGIKATIELESELFEYLTTAYDQSKINETINGKKCHDSTATNYYIDSAGEFVTDNNTCYYLGDANLTQLYALWIDQKNKSDKLSNLTTTLDGSYGLTSSLNPDYDENKFTQVKEGKDIDDMVKLHLADIKATVTQEDLEATTEYIAAIPSDVQEAELERYFTELYRLNNLSGPCGQKSLVMNMQTGSKNFDISYSKLMEGLFEYARADNVNVKISNVDKVNNKVTLEIKSAEGLDGIQTGVFKLSTSVNSKTIDVGIKLCNDSNAKNYATDNNGTQYDSAVIFADNTLCTYAGCMDPHASNYQESYNEASNDECTYYYCNNDDSCNYNVIVDNRGFAVSTNKPLSDHQVKNSLCLIPEVTWLKTSNIETNENEQVNLTHNVDWKTTLLANSITTEGLDGDFIGKWYNDDKTTYREVKLTLTKNGYGELEIENQDVTVSTGARTNVPYDERVFGKAQGTWSITQDRVQISLPDDANGTRTLGYNIKFTHSSYQNRPHLNAYLAIQNQSSEIFRGIVQNNGTDDTKNQIIDVTEWQRVIKSNSRSAKQLELSYACDDVDSFGVYYEDNLVSNKIYSTSNGLVIENKYATAGLPVKYTLNAIKPDSTKNTNAPSVTFYVQYKKKACLDNAAANYDEGVTMNGGTKSQLHLIEANDELCEFNGCTDTSACNYDPRVLAENSNNDTCDYSICKTCDNTTACNYADFAANNAWSFNDGTTTHTATAFNDDLCKFTDECGNCKKTSEMQNLDACGDCRTKYKEDGVTLTDDWNKNCRGCMNSNWDNYDASALAPDHTDEVQAALEDGGCRYYGCDKAGYATSDKKQIGGANPEDYYIQRAGVDADICHTLGCTDETACNYNSNATAGNANASSSCSYTTIDNVSITPNGIGAQIKKVEGENRASTDGITVSFNSSIFKQNISSELLPGKWIYENYPNGNEAAAGRMVISLASNGSATQSMASSNSTSGTWELYDTPIRASNVLGTTIVNSQASALSLSSNSLEVNLKLTFGSTVYYGFVRDYYKTPTGWLQSTAGYTVSADFFKPATGSSGTRVVLKEPANGKSKPSRAKVINIVNEDYTYDSATVEDSGANCQVEKVAWEAKSAYQHVPKLTGSTTKNEFEIPKFDHPGKYTITLKGVLADGSEDSDSTNAAEAEFNLNVYNEGCADKNADNYNNGYDATSVNGSWRVNFLITNEIVDGYAKQNGSLDKTVNIIDANNTANSSKEEYFVPVGPKGADDLCTYTGCKVAEACNYSEHFDNNDLSSCVFQTYPYKCNGECSLAVDCAGTCGGDAVTDCAGVCSNDSNYGSTEVTINGVKECSKDHGMVCCDTNSCSYDATKVPEDATSMGLLCNISLCTYPQNEYTDCDGNCISPAIKDCRSICGIPGPIDENGEITGTDTFKVRDSCGTCGGDSSDCAAIGDATEQKVPGANVSISGHPSRPIRFYDPDGTIEAIFIFQGGVWVKVWGKTVIDSNGRIVANDENIGDVEVPPGRSPFIINSDQAGIGRPARAIVQSLVTQASTVIDMAAAKDADGKDIALNDKTNPMSADITDLKIDKDDIISTSGRTLDEADITLVATGEQQEAFHIKNIPRAYNDSSATPITSIWVKVDFAGVNVRALNPEFNSGGVMSGFLKPNGQPLVNKSDIEVTQIGQASGVWVNIEFASRTDTSHPNYGDITTGNDIVVTIDRRGSNALTSGALLGNLKFSLHDPTIGTTGVVTKSMKA